MKKIEILKIMEANLRIDKTYKYLPWDKKMLPNWWFMDLSHARIVPRIEGLTNELNQLRKETKEIAKITEDAKELLAVSNCKHEIRLSKHNHFGTIHRCILCNKDLYDNPHSYWDPAEMQSTYCINYKHKHQDDSEEPYSIKDGHTKEELYEKIVKILKNKNDDEEIDLVEEFKKLNLKRAEYIDIKLKPETFIMIIGGTNKQFIGNGAYITKPSIDIVKDLYSYFAGQQDTKLLVIDNANVITSIDDFSNIKKAAYSSIKELERILSEHKQDYKLIINISDLYEYSIEDEQIVQKKYELDLQKMYPNSRIIRINNFSNTNDDERKEILNTPSDISFGYTNNEYFQNVKGSLKKKDIKHVIKLINKRKDK